MTICLLFWDTVYMREYSRLLRATYTVRSENIALAQPGVFYGFR